MCSRTSWPPHRRTSGSGGTSARHFPAASGPSPHGYYDEVRAARARDLLRQGLPQGKAARRIGLRRPAELRALLSKRVSLQGMHEVQTLELATVNG